MPVFVVLFPGLPFIAPCVCAQPHPVHPVHSVSLITDYPPLPPPHPTPTNTHTYVPRAGNVKTAALCSFTLTKESAETFSKAIVNHYWFQMYLDDLPIWAMVGEIVASQEELERLEEVRREKKREETRRNEGAGGEHHGNIMCISVVCGVLSRVRCRVCGDAVLCCRVWCRMCS